MRPVPHWRFLVLEQILRRKSVIYHILVHTKAVNSVFRELWLASQARVSMYQSSSVFRALWLATQARVSIYQSSSVFRELWLATQAARASIYQSS